MKKIVKMLTAALAVLTVFNSVPAAAAKEPAKHMLVPGGQPFGVKFFGDGVMVVELEPFYSEGSYVCPAGEGGLQVSDVIKKVNGIEVHSNVDLQQATHGCGGSAVRFTVTRGGKELVKTVTPRKNATGVYLLGAWVRDSCAGIGTVTYYDPQEHCFAALGHGICDKDTSALMPLGSAEVVRTDIRSVTKRQGHLRPHAAGQRRGGAHRHPLRDQKHGGQGGQFERLSDRHTRRKSDQKHPLRHIWDNKRQFSAERNHAGFVGKRRSACGKGTDLHHA